MNESYAVFIALLGLCLGSFLNVVIYRVPRKLPLLLDRSRCPKCTTKLTWYSNIPLLSFITLRGKCASCKAPISFRYPLVEALNAAIYLFFYWQFGISFNFFVYAALGSALIAIFFIDYDFQIIPDSITLPGILIGLGISLIPEGIGIVQSAIGMVVGGGSLYLMAILGEFLFKKEAMGGGDIKMAAMLGALVGWQKVILIFITSSFIGLFASLLLMLISARLRKERVIPFGPFLAAAAIVAVVYGDKLIQLYTTHILTP